MIRVSARRVLSGIGILALVASSATARANWLEASSEHFIVYSDTDEAQLREFASRLERFDKGLRLLFTTSQQTEDEGRRSNPLKIFVLPSPHAVATLHASNADEVMGFYVPRISGSAIFTPRRSATSAPKWNMSAQIILLHLYARHFLYRNVPGAVPVWFAEGFAEVGATARFEEDGGLGFGLAANHRASGLFGKHLLTIEDLLDSTRHKLNKEQVWELYARGWLLTHYCFFTPGKLPALLEYLDAINKGVPNLEAARKHFGDLAELERKLDLYANQPLRYLPLPAEKLTIGPIEIRPLSAGAAAMVPVHMRLMRVLSRENALELVPQARRLATPYPADAEVQSQLAWVEYIAGHLEEAEAAADRALAADSGNYGALVLKGKISMARASAARAKDPAVWRATRAWFVKANKIDSNAAEALVLFYSSFTQAGEKPSENAVLGLNRAFELAPEDPRLRFAVAWQALADGQPKFARSILASLTYDPTAGGRSQKALAAIDLLDAGRNTEALEALQNPPAATEASANEPTPGNEK